MHKESGEGDLLTKRVIGCAIEVLRNLGPGLLESTYERYLAHELMLAGIKVEMQIPSPIEYKGLRIVSSVA